MTAAGAPPLPRAEHRPAASVTLPGRGYAQPSLLTLMALDPELVSPRLGRPAEVGGETLAGPADPVAERIVDIATPPRVSDFAKATMVAPGHDTR